MSSLHITREELQRLYAGRLFLTGSELRRAASVCGVEPCELTEACREDYDQNVVRYMTAFQNREKREALRNRGVFVNTMTF